MTLFPRSSSFTSTFSFIGLLSLLAAPFLAGCTGDVACDGCDNQTTGGAGSSSSSSGSSSSGGTSSSGGMNATWTTLITGDWSLAPGTENTSDIHSKVVDHDTYIGGIRPISPLGTHHTVVALGSLGTTNTIYASGVGTNELLFPKGVGMKIPAGESIYLQLHIFNTSSETLSGTSGVEILEVTPADVEQEANLFLPGPFDFSIPPNQKYSHTGTCTVKDTQNVFAIFPHMHQLGAHFKTTLTIGGAPTVLHDGDYTFQHQAFIPFDPIKLGPGDTISTECTWDNTTPQSVGWGESSTSEMCFSILYRYPAIADSGFCSK